MRKKDDKVGKKTVYKKERQREKKRTRKKDGNIFANFLAYALMRLRVLYDAKVIF